jgi:hypothetical protein
MNIQAGKIVELDHEDRKFSVIVIDPNGLGPNQPSVGFGFGMMERYGGLPTSTSDNWLEGVPNTDSECLKLPSGSTYRVSRVIGEDNNEYVVLEVSQWVAIAAEAIKKSKVKKSTKDKLVDFLSWFAVKGFYADAYALLKGSYTEADSRSVSAWMKVRLMGISRRNRYTRFLQEKGCLEWFDYANWTNYVYKGLFNKDKRQMTEEWDLVEGSKTIGRNYIPETEGLEAVAYCENQVIELFHENLQQAHNDAISFAKRKFPLKFVEQNDSITESN